MLYREAGQYKTAYATDQRIFPILQDRAAFTALMVAAFIVVPLAGNDYWFNGLLIPLLILSLATLGLNILTGYAGQISLGSAGFMGVGAFAAYNFILRVDGMPILGGFVLASLCAALIGVLFGLSCHRIKDFYLIVATLGSQFFIEWVLTKFALAHRLQRVGCHHRAEDRHPRRHLRHAGTALPAGPVASSY